ncbi:MAG: oxidoreductase [Leifsonia sp.]|jgi:predicted dehydrogenase|nr:oxidoreductase [Leifsonia sp.]
MTALPQPRFPDPRDAPSLRWGILAPGAIANDFVDSLRAHTGQRVVAVGSRNADRAAAFAARHEIARSYGSYEELVADPEVDVVYVASPHSEHTAHALLAIGAGKHVLVEKPMAATAAEAQEIVDAARAAGVFAMEAMWTRYLPQTDIARQLLEAGALGEVRVVTADFGGAAEFDPTSRMFDPRLAGGALLDIGVYPVSFASFAMGAPTSVIASGELAPTGVDAQAALILTGPTGAQALLSTSVLARTPWTASIAGTLGRIDIHSPFWCASGVTVHDIDGNFIGTWRDESGRPDRQGMCYQAAALARYVAAGLTESPLHSLDETVSIIATIDEARRQLGYVRVGHAAE